MNAGDGVFWLLATTVGLVYALAVHVVHEHAPESPYTALWVIGGVLISLGLAALVVEGPAVLVLLGIFGATGVWQVLGSMWRWYRGQESRRDGREIRRALNE